MNFIVGITGGIGSGKTAVTWRLNTLGIDIIDADLIARKIVEPGELALEKISSHFGKNVLLPNGQLNRAALRIIVFSDTTEKDWLEKLTHPLIEKEITKQIASAKSQYIVLSSALLLDSGQSKLVNFVVVIDTSEQLQISRAVERDQNNESLIRKIIDSQISRRERLSKADLILDNSGSLETLDKKVKALHKDLLFRAQRHHDESG